MSLNLLNLISNKLKALVKALQRHFKKKLINKKNDLECQNTLPLNCVACQYYKFDLSPEVSPSRGSWFSEMTQTDRQTDNRWTLQIVE